MVMHFPLPWITDQTIVIFGGLIVFVIVFRPAVDSLLIWLLARHERRQYERRKI